MSSPARAAEAVLAVVVMAALTLDPVYAVTNTYPKVPITPTSGSVAVSDLYCNVPKYVIPSCATVDMSRLACRSAVSQMLPMCTSVSNVNVRSLTDLLCPVSGKAALPSCLKVTSSNVGTLSPSKLSAGQFSSSVIVTDGSIVAPVGTNKLAAGALPSAVTVGNNNFAAGSISTSKFATGQVVTSVKAASANFVSGSLNTNRLMNGNLPSGVQVTNNNMVANTLSPSILSSGTLPSTIKFGQSNVNAGALSPDRLTCQGASSLVNWGSCLGANADNLYCSGASEELPACARIPGNQISGDIGADQVSGALTAAYLSVDNIRCPTVPGSPTPLDDCVKVDATQQLVCDSSTTNELACLKVAGSQLTGFMNSTIVPGSIVTGTLNSSYSYLDGKAVSPSSTSGSALGAVLAYRYNLIAPYDGTNTVQFCCAAGHYPTSCSAPVFPNSLMAITKYGYIISPNGLSISPNSDNGGSGYCCNWDGIYSPAGLGNPMELVFEINCLPARATSSNMASFSMKAMDSERRRSGDAFEIHASVAPIMEDDPVSSSA